MVLYVLLTDSQSNYSYQLQWNNQPENMNIFAFILFSMCMFFLSYYFSRFFMLSYLEFSISSIDIDVCYVSRLNCVLFARNIQECNVMVAIKILGTLHWQVKLFSLLEACAVWFNWKMVINVLYSLKYWICISQLIWMAMRMSMLAILPISVWFWKRYQKITKNN